MTPERSPSSKPNRKKSSPPAVPLTGIALVLLVVGGLISLFTGHAASLIASLHPPVEKPLAETVPNLPPPTSEPSEPEEIEEPEPQFDSRIPLSESIPAGGGVRKLANGIQYSAEVIFEDGRHAATERKDDSAYTANYSLKLRLPAAATTVAELEVSNPDLEKILPSLPKLLEKATVSPFYRTLYENKAKRIKRNATQLDDVLSRHNFFDCDTLLQLTENGQRILIMQGDMDVVSDGSDGDRLAEMPDRVVNSTHYQPFTSYGWKKVTDRENPMIKGWRQRIQNADDEIVNPATTSERKKWLIDRKKMLRRGIEDMQNRSFLIADYDPFIVLPVNLLTARNTKFTGRVGDYAVVIYGDRVFPAIVGDGGPTFKVGEGSLRLAKELNPRSTSYSRPVSSLGVTYLVFCGSAGPKAAPNYDLWRSRCSELLAGIGGLGEGYELHTWTDLFPKEEDVVEPAVEAAVEPTPVPAAE